MRPCFAIFLGAMAGCASLPAQELMSDNFDSGHLTNWTLNTPAGAAVRIVNQPATFCVEFSDDSPSGVPEMWRNFATSRSGRALFSVFVPATNRAPFQMQLRAASGAFLTAVRLGEDGKMSYNATPGGNGPFTTSSTSWPTGAWRTVRVDWQRDFTFSAWLGTNQFAAGVPFGTNAWPGQILFRLATSSQTGRVAYLDDVVVTSVVPRRVVGYYPSWMKTAYPYTKVGYEHVTHLAHAFITPNTNGSLNVPAGFLYPELVQQANARGVKIIVSVGGGSGSANFPALANDATARARFVQELTSFCASNNYDGADIDWERPSNATDRANFTLLLQQLRAAFDSANPAWTISAAVGSTSWSGQWLDVDQIKNYLDWFGVMTYDYHGPWTSHAGHNAPLYGSAADPEGAGFGSDGSAQYYLGRNIPKDQILLGIPFYNRQFYASALYAPSTSPNPDGFQYADVMQKLSNGWTRVWDTTSLVPYLQDAGHTQLVTYDDPVSVRLKCDYLAWRGLGGVILWALGQDLYQNQTPLLNVVGSAMLGSTNVAVALPDTDGDGQPDGAEALAGTNPTNPASVFRASITGGSNILWTAVSGKRYCVEYRDEWTNGWSALTGPILATGPLTNYVDVTAPAAAQRFYRVTLLPE